MTILHVCSEKTWRGGEQQVAYLHDGLITNQILSVIACKKGSSLENYCLTNQIPHVSFPFKGNFDFSTARRLKNFVKELNPDLVHIHTSRAHNIALLAYFMGLRVPFVLSRRVDFPLKKNPFSIYKYRHPAIRKIICVSKAIQRIVEQVVADSRVMTIHSGVSLGRFKHSDPENIRVMLSLPKSCKIVGNTSAIADHKDYKTFVDTAQIILNDYPETYFLIVGAGPDFPEIAKYIQGKELDKKIIMTGEVDNVGDYLKAFDCFLFTSKAEGLGTSVLDALTVGIPVVSTNAGGIPEMIQHEETGLINNTRDANGLANSVIRILEDQALREKLIQGAKKKVKEFDKEITVRKTIKVYQEVLADTQ